MGLKYDKFLTKFKEASDVVMSAQKAGVIAVDNPQELAVAMAVHCDNKESSDYQIGKEGQFILDFCVEPRREKEIIAAVTESFKEINSRRVKYLTKKLVDSGKMKRISWGKVVIQSWRDV